MKAKYALAALLAVLALTAFPTSSALATPADEVTFTEDGCYPSSIYVYLSTTTSGATIFATVGNHYIPADPTHSGGTATGNTFICTQPIIVFAGQNKWIKAIAWRSDLTDSAVNILQVDNTAN
jgi:hypothetical protein